MTVQRQAEVLREARQLAQARLTAPVPIAQPPPASAYDTLREVVCSACGVHLYKIDEANGPSVNTPFAAHVVSRQRSRGDNVTEIPQVCSRACLHKVVATYDFRDDANDLVPAIYGNMSIVENERLVLLWGTEIPETPHV